MPLTLRVSSVESTLQQKSPQSGSNAFLAPYLMEDAAKTPGLNPTKIPVGGTSLGHRIPLSTPADMDGHFLQKFDDALTDADSDESKNMILSKFL